MIGTPSTLLRLILALAVAFLLGFASGRAAAQSATCVIAGDSIAFGLAQLRPECSAYVRSGISSQGYNRAWPEPLTADAAVISLGSNDGAGFDTFSELAALRLRTAARRVFWILPAIHPKVRADVLRVAQAHRDVVLEIPKPMADHAHPTWTGYKALAEATR